MCSLKWTVIEINRAERRGWEWAVVRDSGKGRPTNDSLWVGDSKWMNEWMKGQKNHSPQNIVIKIYSVGLTDDEDVAVDSTSQPPPPPPHQQQLLLNSSSSFTCITVIIIIITHRNGTHPFIGENWKGALYWDSVSVFVGTFIIIILYYQRRSTKETPIQWVLIPNPIPHQLYYNMLYLKCTDCE